MDLMKDWIADLALQGLRQVVETLESADNNLNSSASTYSKVDGQLVIPHDKGQAKAHFVQILSFSDQSGLPWSVSLSDGMSEIRATFHRDCIRRFEAKRAVIFKDCTVGAVLALTDFQILCDLERTTPCSLSLHIIKFNFEGGEGSENFGHPIRLEEHEVVQQALSRLSTTKDQRERILPSPIGSKPDASIKFDSVQDPHDMHSQFLTQPFASNGYSLYAFASASQSNRGVRSRDESKGAASKTAALFEALEERQISARRDSMKLCREAITSSTTLSLSNNSPAKPILDAGLTTDPARLGDGSRKSNIRAPRSDSRRQQLQNYLSGFSISPGSSAHSQKGTRHKECGNKRLEVQPDSFARVEQKGKEIILDVFEEEEDGIFSGLCRIPRRYSKVSKEQRKFLDHPDAWFQLQNGPKFARVPQDGMSNLCSYAAHAAQDRAGPCDKNWDETCEHRSKRHTTHTAAALDRISGVQESLLLPKSELQEIGSDQELEEVLQRQTSESGEISWSSSSVGESRQYRAEMPQSSDLVIDSREIDELILQDGHSQWLPGSTSRPSFDQVLAEETSVLSSVKPDTSHKEDCDQESYQLQTVQSIPLVPLTSSQGAEDALEIEIPCAVNDLEEDTKVATEEEPEMTLISHTPSCGQGIAATDLETPFLIQVQRTPFGRSSAAVTATTSNWPVIPGTFNPGTNDDIGTPSSFPGPRTSKRHLSEDQYNDCERPLKRKSRSGNIDSLNFTQEREPQNVNDILRQHRQRFKRAVQDEAMRHVDQSRPQNARLIHKAKSIKTISGRDDDVSPYRSSPRLPEAAPTQLFEESHQQPFKIAEADEQPADVLSYYDLFQASYPDYTGSQDSFLIPLIYIEWLMTEGRPPPRFIWDDFVRAFVEYGRYLKHCRATGSVPTTYIEYYCLEVIEPLYAKRIITPGNLKDIIAMDTEKADIYRRKFRQNPKAIRTQLHDGTGFLGTSTHSQVVSSAATESVVMHNVTLQDMAESDIKGSPEQSQEDSRRVSAQNEHSSLDQPDLPHGKVDVAFEDFESESVVLATPATKKRFFETASQMPTARENRLASNRNSIALNEKTPQDIEHDCKSSIKSIRKLPWISNISPSDQETASAHGRFSPHKLTANVGTVVRSGPAQLSSTMSAHRKNEVLKSITTPRKSSAAHSFSSPILGHIDDGPNIVRTKDSTHHRTEVAGSLPHLSTQHVDAVISRQKSKTKSSRSSVSDVEKVEEWLEAQSDCATFKEKQVSNLKSRRLSLIEIREEIRKTLADSGKREAAVADVVRYYIPKRPRKSGKYTMLSAPEIREIRPNSGEDFGLRE